VRAAYCRSREAQIHFKKINRNKINYIILIKAVRTKKNNIICAAMLADKEEKPHRILNG